MTDFERALASYHEHRQAVPGEPFCHAPFVNIHFSHGGEVLACCHNRTFPLGTYPTNSLEEIWSGDRARELRQAVVAADFSKGCHTCLRQLLGGDLVGLDDMAGSYRDASFTELWKADRASASVESLTRLPVTLEFELHNTCNLECVMCHGVASSRIRKNRDALPAVPSPYDKNFVDQLAKILPHARSAGFTGGEPFLIPVYDEIWNKIAEFNPGLHMMLVTNGTVLNRRVKDLVESLNFTINVSLDSIVKETYESIRVGSSHDLVMENSRYFAEVMRERGRPFIWRCCVMRENWREVPAMVHYCNENGIRVIFNQVDFPLNFSLHTLPLSDLKEIAHFLSESDDFDENDSVQTFNLQQYRGLLARIESFARAENWKNGFVDRLEIARSNPMLNAISVKGAGLSPHADADALAERASVYVATRLTVDQAMEAAGQDEVPENARRSLAERRAEVTEFLTEMPWDVFLRVFLNVAMRTYLKVMGVRKDHRSEVFREIDPLVRSIGLRADRGEIVGEIVDRAPEKIYELVSRRSSSDGDVLAGGEGIPGERRKRRANVDPLEFGASSAHSSRRKR